VEGGQKEPEELYRCNTVRYKKTAGTRRKHTHTHTRTQRRKDSYTTTHDKQSHTGWDSNTCTVTYTQRHHTHALAHHQ